MIYYLQSQTKATLMLFHYLTPTDAILSIIRVKYSTIESFSACTLLRD